MSQFPQSPEPAAPLSPQPPGTPPTDIGDIALPPEPPSWPKVVGIISIVVGALFGLGCNACGLAGTLGGSAMMSMVPPEQRASMQAQMAAAGPAQIAVYAGGMLIGVLLIIAGIFTIQRKPLGRILHLAYGALAVLLTIIGAAVGWSGMQAQMAAMKADPNLAQQAAAMQGGMYIGLAFGVCLGLAYPIFCIVWFGAIKRTHRDMTGGFEEEPLV